MTLAPFMFKTSVDPRVAGVIVLSCGLALSWRVGAQNASHLYPLESFDLSLMSAGWQKPLAGKSIDGNPLKIKGQTFERGVGTHATSELAIDLGGQAKRFSAMVGVDDEVENRGSIDFEIYVDGKLVAQSGTMRRGDAAKPLDVDLAGAKQLILAVQDGGDDINFDHADWGDAVLEMLPNATFKPVAVKARSVNAVDDPTPMPIFKASQISDKPQIHGARVTGATPGRPFFFSIAATGQGPLTYSAKNLPAGLVLDAATGRVTGSLRDVGTTVAQLRVKGAKGTTTRNLTIVAGYHVLAQTPPMGWNSWNIYYTSVDEKKVRDATDWMVKRGLDKHGYEYVNIDDAWQAGRDAQGNIVVNEKFGDMKALGDYIHSKGFKFGTYSSPGPTTCGGYTGSYQHEAQDAATYSKWGIDYLKYDWCSYGSVAVGEGLERQKIPYRTMRKALDGISRDIVYSLCQYGMGDVWKWGNEPGVGGDLWRTTDDIRPNYNSMKTIGFSQSDESPYARPSGWNDPDMLFMHALEPNEQLTHLSLWSLLGAPLLIGSDLAKVSDFTIDALSNDEVIEIDQDPLGKAATRRNAQGTLEVWARPLWDGTMAVGLFNKGRATATVNAKWSDLGLSGKQAVRDLWQQKNLGSFKEGYGAVIPGHGAVLIKVGKPNAKDYSPKAVR